MTARMIPAGQFLTGLPGEAVHLGEWTVETKLQSYLVLAVLTKLWSWAWVIGRWALCLLVHLAQIIANHCFIETRFSFAQRLFRPSSLGKWKITNYTTTFKWKVMLISWGELLRQLQPLSQDFAFQRSHCANWFLTTIMKYRDWLLYKE